MTCPADAQFRISRGLSGGCRGDVRVVGHFWDVLLGQPCWVYWAWGRGSGAFVNGQERSLHITSPWQSDFVVEQPPEPPEPPEEVQMSETAEAQDAQLPSAEVPVTSPDAAEAAEAVEDEAACPKETKSVAPAEKISTSSDAATEPAEGSHERSDTGDEAKNDAAWAELLL